MMKDAIVIRHGGRSPDLLLLAHSDVLGVRSWNLHFPNLQHEPRNSLIGRELNPGGARKINVVEALAMMNFPSYDSKRPRFLSRTCSDVHLAFDQQVFQLIWTPALHFCVPKLCSRTHPNTTLSPVLAGESET
ncbi:hypothetical protein OIU74_004053 [Salix koriyanagi]|uniref:Uncharacterized protein n=1 Tax=Salix koriyanagi TaxID=2511006 RepID=A0A9Q0ZLU9_9ROSI|nr:hypothetical protein OIU74_004053 [Salix koriyanagi]